MKENPVQADIGYRRAPSFAQTKEYLKALDERCAQHEKQKKSCEGNPFDEIRKALGSYLVF